MKVRLPVRLFLSYAVVSVVGALAAYLTVRLLAPQIFNQRMSMMEEYGLDPEDSMMGTGSGMGMGLGQGQGQGPGQGQGLGRGLGFAGVHDAFMSSLDIALLVGVLASLLVAVLVAAFVTWRVLRPLEDVRAATRQIAAGDYNALVPEPSEPEMAELAADVNTLATALSETESRRTRLLGDVAHEMRTPLTSLDGYVEGMIDGVFPADEQTLGSVSEELRRLHRLADDLSALSRAQEQRFDLALADADLSELARTAADRLRPQFDDAQIALIVEAGTPIPVYVDPDRTMQVLTNLLGNALVATGPGGTVRVLAEAGESSADVKVIDTGVGLEGADTERIFERFYRAAGNGRRSGGSGVGLTISREIAHAMGGSLSATSAGRGLGATFTLHLPLR